MSFSHWFLHVNLDLFYHTLKVIIHGTIKSHTVTRSKIFIKHLCMVIAASSLSGCLGIGVTVAKPVYSSMFLFGSGVLGFNNGYISLLDFTSRSTPLDEITPLSCKAWDDVPTMPSPHDATAILVLLCVVAGLFCWASGWAGANEDLRQEQVIKNFL